MTLPSIAAARAGMVKWPVVVPSPLSCRLREHFSRAACSSVRMSSFSWASTIFWSGSTASIARRAIRRSWSGLNRAAFATSSVSTVWRCSALTPCRELAGGSDDHCRVFWGDQPGVQSLGGGVVPGVELTSQGDLSGCVRTGHGGGLREPGVGTGEPGVLRDAGLICGRDQLELVGLQPPDRTVDLRHVSAADGSKPTGVVCSRSITPCTSATPRPTASCGVGVEVEERCHGTIL